MEQTEDSFYGVVARVIQCCAQGENACTALLSPNHRRLSQLQGLSQLVYIDLTRCHIQDIADGLTALTSCKYLLLDDNLIQEFPAGLTELPALELLSLELNPLRSMAPIQSQTLQHLNLNHTSVTVVPNLVAGLPSLSSLTLQGCRIDRIEPQQNRTLAHIDLSDTCFADFCYLNRCFPCLRCLDVDFSEGSALVFASLVSNRVFRDVQVINEERVCQPSDSARTQELRFAVQTCRSTLRHCLLLPLLSQQLRYLGRLALSKCLMQTDLRNADGIYGHGQTYQSSKEVQMMSNLRENIDECRKLLSRVKLFNQRLFNCVDEISYLLNHNYIHQLYDLNDVLLVHQLNMASFQDLVLKDIDPGCLSERALEIIREIRGKLAFSMEVEPINDLHTCVHINKGMYDRLKQKLLEEIEISAEGCVVEYRPEKFAEHFEQHTAVKYVFMDGRNGDQIVDTLREVYGSADYSGMLEQGTIQLQDSPLPRLTQKDYMMALCVLQFTYSDQSRLYTPVFNVINNSVEWYRSMLDGKAASFAEEVEEQYNGIVTTYNSLSRSQAPCTSSYEQCLQKQVSKGDKAVFVVGYDDLEEFRLEGCTSVEELHLQNNCNLARVVLSGLPRLRKLEISFCPKMGLEELAQQVSPEMRQQIQELEFYQVEGDRWTVGLGLVLGMFKNVAVLNGQTVDRARLCENDAILQVEPNIFQLNEHSAGQPEPPPRCPPALRCNVELAGSGALSISKGMADMQSAGRLDASGCWRFQYQNLRVLHLVSLNVAGIGCSVDRLLASGLYVGQLQHLDVSSNWTENTYQLGVLAAVRCLSMDYVSGLDCGYLVQQLGTLSQDQLECLSCRAAVPPGEALECQLLIRLAEKQRGSLRRLRTFESGYYGVAAYLSSLRELNGHQLDARLVSLLLDDYTRRISADVVRQRGRTQGDELDLSGALLQSLEAEPGVLCGCTKLLLARNRIGRLVLPPYYAGVRYLDLSDNSIGEPFTNGMAPQNNALECLVLCNNPITALRPPAKAAAALSYNLYNLTCLDISGTQQCKALQSQTFSQFGNLRKLIMNGCYFINISSEALLGLDKLEELQLNGCRLRDCVILEGVKQYKQLRVLLLADNAISTCQLVVNVISQLRLRQIDVRNNRFCKVGGHRAQIIEAQMQSIQLVDGEPVSDAERQRIAEMIRQREEERQKKMGVTVLQLGGGPGRR